MKCTIPEISWHNREPVLSVDIYPENGKCYRLASGGGDCHVLIWQMKILSNGAVEQEVVSDLTRHQRAVNCVRWSSSGKYLASGDDDSNIIVWKLKTDNIPLLEGDSGDKEVYIVHKVMRGHKEDVYDICWSMDESKILSGSVDNTAILWDVAKGKMDHILTDHKGFVQGVAWDPKNQLIATISTDKICRIFDPLGKHVKARIQKGKITSVPDNHFLKDKDAKYFHDDTFKSFFRRLQFTPDGSLLVVPSGYIEVDSCKPVNATLMFTLDNFSSPAIILPIPRQSSTVVRCCPVLFELREEGPDSIVKLPYRMVFAVGTDRDIILYDTQQTLPFARFQDIHYTRLTDLTWSQDGLLLIGSSTDGFCSLVTFEMDELGVPWVKMESEAEENPLEISGCQELSADKDENVDTNNKDVKKEEVVVLVKQELREETKKRPSFLEQWALKTPKKKKLDDSCNKKTPSAKAGESEVVKIQDSPEKSGTNEESVDVDKREKSKLEKPVNILIPKRKLTNPFEVRPAKGNNSSESKTVKIQGSSKKSCTNKKTDGNKLQMPIINILIPKRKIITPSEDRLAKDNSSENDIVEIPDSPGKSCTNEETVSRRKIDVDKREGNKEKPVNILIPRRKLITPTEDKLIGKDNSSTSKEKEVKITTPPSEDRLIGKDNSSKSEVVEIQDSPEKSSTNEEIVPNNKLEKTINILIPKRKVITPSEDRFGKDNHPSTSKEKINILTPKRIKPTLVESKPRTH